MTNKEITIFTNAMTIIPKIEVKEHYSEEDYANIYQLIEAYKKLKKYYSNYESIENLLNRKMENYSFFQLIKAARNRVSHSDKSNGEEEVFLLLVFVDKEDVWLLLKELYLGLEDIFKHQIGGDVYKLTMNTRPMILLIRAVKYTLYERDYLNEFDRYCSEKLKKILKNFDPNNSTFEEFEMVKNKINKFCETKIFKQGFIKMYDEQIYNGLMRMMNDDTFTQDEAKEWINSLKTKSLSISSST